MFPLFNTLLFKKFVASFIKHGKKQSLNKKIFSVIKNFRNFWFFLSFEAYWHFVFLFLFYFRPVEFLKKKRGRRLIFIPYPVSKRPRRQFNVSLRIARRQILINDTMLARPYEEKILAVLEDFYTKGDNLFYLHQQTFWRDVVSNRVYMRYRWR
jgi:hypothetical protein